MRLAYLRKKRIGDHLYLYRVESYRDPEGRRRERVLEYLGPLRPIYQHHVIQMRHTVNARDVARAPTEDDPALTGAEPSRS
jgi:hypothetical protein